MKRSSFVLAVLPLAVFASAGCGADGASQSVLPSDVPKDSSPVGSESTAAEGNTWHHPASLSEEPGSDIPSLVAEVAGPGPAARIHGCGKIPSATLRRILESRGGNLGNGAAADLFANGQNALGAPNYGSRVGEATFATAAAMTKQFDVTVAATEDVVNNLKASDGCKDVTLVENDALTKAGISCLIGKPAKDEHVALANDLVGKAVDRPTGIRLAVSALLSAAHTCE